MSNHLSERQLTKFEASLMGDIIDREKWDSEKIVKLQLFQERLCVSKMNIFKKALCEVMGRTLDTLTAASDKIVVEYLETHKAPTTPYILSLIPKIKPIDVTPGMFSIIFPSESVFQSMEVEGVAGRIMKILSKTGNTFRELTWTQYESGCRDMGKFVSGDFGYFPKVMPYCVSAEKAFTFSPEWKDIVGNPGK